MEDVFSKPNTIQVYKSDSICKNKMRLHWSKRFGIDKVTLKLINLPLTDQRYFSKSERSFRTARFK